MAVSPDSDPVEVGDEPLLIARRSRCPVFICADRLAAGRALLQRGGCDIVISDDGLQHYALARDIEIAVIDGERRCGNGLCLPAGPLREPAERLGDVDLVVCQGRPETGEFAMTLSGEYAVNLLDETCRKPLVSFSGMPLRAIAGIGNPGRFFAHLRHLGLECKERAFPDHHLYQRQDLGFGDDLPILMTEKDAVKCKRFAAAHHWSVPVEAILPPAFGDNLLKLLRAKCDGQKTARHSGVSLVQGGSDLQERSTGTDL
jgi:tetraacyldisaccharide 4'-kinase